MPISKAVKLRFNKSLNKRLDNTLLYRMKKISIYQKIKFVVFENFTFFEWNFWTWVGCGFDINYYFYTKIVSMPHLDSSLFALVFENYQILFLVSLFFTLTGHLFYYNFFLNSKCLINNLLSNILTSFVCLRWY